MKKEKDPFQSDTNISDLEVHEIRGLMNDYSDFNSLNEAQAIRYRVLRDELNIRSRDRRDRVVTTATIVIAIATVLNIFY